jgi:hypothetical protein
MQLTESSAYVSILSQRLIVNIEFYRLLLCFFWGVIKRPTVGKTSTSSSFFILVAGQGWDSRCSKESPGMSPLFVCMPVWLHQFFRQYFCHTIKNRSFIYLGNACDVLFNQTNHIAHAGSVGLFSNYVVINLSLAEIDECMRQFLNHERSKWSIDAFREEKDEIEWTYVICADEKGRLYW